MSLNYRVRRNPEREILDVEQAYQILDEGSIAHVSFVEDNIPYNIPMIYARDGNRIIIHCSIKSRFYKTLSYGTETCATVTILDGIVVAKSAFHCSMNYRSVMLFGSMKPITDGNEKMLASRIITEKIIPGRWSDCRQPNQIELKSTGFLEMKIETFSAKARRGWPKDDPADSNLPYWSGVIPVKTYKSKAKGSPSDNNNIRVPSYIN